MEICDRGSSFVRMDEPVVFQRSIYGWRSAIVGLIMIGVVAMCALAQDGVAPSVSMQQTSTQPALTPSEPVPLSHLYGQFLIYQNLLDTKATELEAKGQDGSWFRNHLQVMMGFSDVDYASIRASSMRLSSELTALAAQAAVIRNSDISPASAAQLKILATQRNSYINDEISSLKQALSPERIVAFEMFITNFFAPKNLTFQVSPSAQPAPATVQP